MEPFSTKRLHLYWLISVSIEELGETSVEGSGDVIARSSQPLFGLMMNMRSLDKAVELNYQWIAFDDVCYHVQVTVKNPNLLLLVVSLPNPPPEAMSFDGLPLGAIEAIKATYRTGFQEVEVLSHITWKPKWGMIFSDFVFLCY
ncbi:predicted protein [Arabidopsis lyrata subsp. lyrata]|uniref:Predicted protein n=1 Tax=Arabidopsis lyrata subsp. lyrata TaxID=81972 RepID=D7M5G4_ARALL|nr:predicted protein [Arabidopsis lyrata subsp. lyrata]